MLAGTEDPMKETSVPSADRPVGVRIPRAGLVPLIIAARRGNLGLKRTARAATDRGAPVGHLVRVDRNGRRRPQGRRVAVGALSTAEPAAGSRRKSRLGHTRGPAIADHGGPF